MLAILDPELARAPPPVPPLRTLSSPWLTLPNGDVDEEEGDSAVLSFVVGVAFVGSEEEGDTDVDAEVCNFSTTLDTDSPFPLASRVVAPELERDLVVDPLPPNNFSSDRFVDDAVLSNSSRPTGAPPPLIVETVPIEDVGEAGRSVELKEGPLIMVKRAC